MEAFQGVGANGSGKCNNDDPNLNINVGDRVVTNESSLTDSFNFYFVNVASNLKEPIIPLKFLMNTSNQKSLLILNF